MMNMAAAGAMLAKRPFLPIEILEQALIDHLPSSKTHLLDNNLQVIRHAFQLTSVGEAHAVNGSGVKI